MSELHLLVASDADDASRIMGDYIERKVHFEPEGDKGRLLRYDNYIMVKISQKHLFMNTLPPEVIHISDQISDVIFLSRHSSSADIKSITVHPTGNFSRADLGGETGKLSESDPEKMSAALRRMKDLYSGDYFSVTFEATHHGPLLDIPNFYIEIGTSEREWTQETALNLITEGVLSEPRYLENFVGVGGGHYMPKITEYFYNNSINMGHMISKHSLENISIELVRKSVARTRNCKGFIVDKKGTKSVARAIVEAVADELSLELIKI